MFRKICKRLLNRLHHAALALILAAVHITAFATPAYVTTTDANNTTTVTTSHQLAFAGAISVGSRLGVCGFSDRSITAVSDSVNGAYTEINTITGSDSWITFCYSFASTAAGTPTVTVTTSSNATTYLTVFEYTDAVTIVDKDEATGTASSVTCTAMTATAASQMMVGFVGHNVNATNAPANGETEQNDYSDNVQIEEKAVSAGSVAPQWTLATSQVYGCIDWILASAPTITDLETDEDITDGETSLTLTGTGFLDAQGTGNVEICQNSNHTSCVSQTETAWANTAVDFTFGISTLTPGTAYAYVTNGAAGINATGLTITIHAAVSPPTFDSGATYAYVDTNTIRGTYNPSADATHAYIALYPIGTSNPSAATLIAGTGAHGVNDDATPNAAGDTLDVDATDASPQPFPWYKACMVLSNAGGNSAVSCTDNVPLQPATGTQFTQLTSVAAGSTVKYFNDATAGTLNYDAQSANFHVGGVVKGGTSGAYARLLADTDAGGTGTLTIAVLSGTFQDNEAITDSYGGAAVVNGTLTAKAALAANDILNCKTVVLPDGVAALTVGVDGHFSYTATGRQYALDCLAYDYTAAAYLATELDIDFWNGNAAPNGSPPLDLILTEGVAMTAADIAALFSDTDGDAIEIGRIDLNTVSGLSFSASTGLITGTPTNNAQDGTQLTFLGIDGGVDGPGESDTQIVNVFIAPWAMPDYVTASYLDAIDQVETFAHGSLNSIGVTFAACDDMGDAFGVVTAQSPVAAADLSPGDDVTFTVAYGPCSVGIPAGWASVLRVTSDPDFRALMVVEADTNSVWAYWLPGAIHGSANLRINLPLIKDEANGQAVWARWDNSTVHNSANLQLNAQLALGAGFALSP